MTRLSQWRCLCPHSSVHIMAVELIHQQLSWTWITWASGWLLVFKRQSCHLDTKRIPTLFTQYSSSGFCTMPWLLSSIGQPACTPQAVETLALNQKIVTALLWKSMCVVNILKGEIFSCISHLWFREWKLREITATDSNSCLIHQG